MPSAMPALLLRARRRTRGLLPAVLMAASIAALAAQAPAQRLNDPATCPYCHNDAALLKAAGLVSHGGFEFGKGKTEDVDKLLATSDIRWIETPHFEIGFGVGSYKVKQEDKLKIRGELERLAVALPEINPRTKVLDPWLRAHLFALRCEDMWTRFLALVKKSETDFPSGPRTWKMTGMYMGEGPYLGQNGKFEVLIIPNRSVLTSFLKDQFGLLTSETQRWNVIDRETLIAAIQTDEAGLRDDTALHGHVAFNQHINFLDAYRHYSYETPIWIREGLGHLVEREICQDFNTFDSSEGAVADKTSKGDWKGEVKRMVARGDVVRMAEMINLKGYADVTLRHHYVAWSMVDFLVAVHPAEFVCLNDQLHGRMGQDGYPDGSHLEDVHRDAFKECLHMGYAEFDAAWATWVLSAY